MSDTYSEKSAVDTKIFEIDDVVWAKVKGFPWWPAIVANVTKKGSYLLNFIGHNSHSYLTPDKIEIMSDNPEYLKKFLMKKNKGQKSAYDAAIKIVKGESNFLNESEKVQEQKNKQEQEKMTQLPKKRGRKPKKKSRTIERSEKTLTENSKIEISESIDENWLQRKKQKKSKSKTTVKKILPSKKKSLEFDFENLQQNLFNDFQNQSTKRSKNFDFVNPEKPVIPEKNFMDARLSWMGDNDDFSHNNKNKTRKTSKKASKSQNQAGITKPKLGKGDKSFLDSASCLNLKSQIMGTNLQEQKVIFTPDELEINIQSIEQNLAIPQAVSNRYINEKEPINPFQKQLDNIKTFPNTKNPNLAKSNFTLNQSANQIHSPLNFSRVGSIKNLIVPIQSKTNTDPNITDLNPKIDISPEKILIPNDSNNAPQIDSIQKTPTLPTNPINNDYENTNLTNSIHSSSKNSLKQKSLLRKYSPKIVSKDLIIKPLFSNTQINFPNISTSEQLSKNNDCLSNDSSKSKRSLYSSNLNDKSKNDKNILQNFSYKNKDFTIDEQEEKMALIIKNLLKIQNNTQLASKKEVFESVLDLFENTELYKIDPDVLINSQLGRNLKQTHDILIQMKEQIPREHLYIIPQLKIIVRKLTDTLVARYLEPEEMMSPDLPPTHNEAAYKNHNMNPYNTSNENIMNDPEPNFLNETPMKLLKTEGNDLHDKNQLINDPNFNQASEVEDTELNQFFNDNDSFEKLNNNSNESMSISKLVKYIENSLILNEKKLNIKPKESKRPNLPKTSICTDKKQGLQPQTFNNYTISSGEPQISDTTVNIKVDKQIQKKVSKKIYKALLKKKNISKEEANGFVTQIKDKLNAKYSDNLNDYKKHAIGIYKVIKKGDANKPENQNIETLIEKICEL